MTEQQIPKLAGALVEHQNAFSILSVEDGQWVIQNTVAAIGLFAEAVRNRPEAAQQKSGLMRLLVPGVNIPEAPAVKVADCFKVGDGVYVYRDSDCDKWLPKTFPAVGPGNASTFELTENLNFQEIVEAHLGVSGSIDELKKMLIEKDKCWSPLQIDELIRRCERGDNPLKLRTDGRPHFFFMQVGDDVFAAHARRYPVGWDVYVYSFEGALRWRVEVRVSFRN